MNPAVPEMRTLEDIWPPFGLRITCGDVELSPVRDADIPALAAVAAAGVRRPGAEAFVVDWDRGTPAEVARSLAQYHWRTRAEASADRWAVEFTVRRAGMVVGVQGVRTDRFPATRSVSTGSWLGLAHQGRGAGTLMRQMIAVLLFDELSAVEMRTSAAESNAASIDVSEKVGYLPNGRSVVPLPNDRAGTELGFRLTPDGLRRPADPVTVTGAEAFRTFFEIGA